MSKFPSNYPPGVTGNEYEIAGPDFERDYPEPCPRCGGQQVEQGYRGERWVFCADCNYPNPELEGGKCMKSKRGRCPICGYSVRLQKSGRIGRHFIYSHLERRHCWGENRELST